jgi:5'-3' exonuclease
MIVHLVDGTYELFRHFYGLRRFNKGQDRPYGAVVGVLQSLLQMIEHGATHVGVATDHVIESFRNRLWPGYKTGEGIEPALLNQFHPLEEAQFGVEPALIPDFLALAGDAADGYPGISGIGAVTAARLLNQHGAIEGFPKQVLGQQHDLALRFKALATLRTDAPLFCNVDELLWRGATESFASCTQRMDAPRLLDRCLKARFVRNGSGRDELVYQDGAAMS